MIPGPIDCPACEVPPPRAVMGTPKSAQICSVVRTSATVLGHTTPSGTIWYTLASVE